VAIAESVPQADMQSVFALFVRQLTRFKLTLQRHAGLLAIAEPLINAFNATLQNILSL